MKNAVEDNGFYIAYGYVLTNHARKRMKSRGISQAAINAALTYGRVIYTRGAKIYVIGKKESQQYSKLNKWQGIQVVCSPKEQVIITVYRNNNLRFKL